MEKNGVLAKKGAQRAKPHKAIFSWWPHHEKIASGRKPKGVSPYAFLDASRAVVCDLALWEAFGLFVIELNCRAFCFQNRRLSSFRYNKIEWQDDLEGTLDKRKRLARTFERGLGAKIEVPVL